VFSRGNTRCFPGVILGVLLFCPPTCSPSLRWYRINDRLHIKPTAVLLSEHHPLQYPAWSGFGMHPALILPYSTPRLRSKWSGFGLWESFNNISGSPLAGFQVPHHIGPFILQGGVGNGFLPIQPTPAAPSPRRGRLQYGASLRTHPAARQPPSRPGCSRISSGNLPCCSPAPVEAGLQYG
jgi:hypothetical protein